MGGTNLRFELPSYDTALFDAVHDIQRFILKTFSIAGDVPSRTTIHAGPTRNVSGPTPLDQPHASASASMEIPWDVVRRGDIEAFSNLVVGFVLQFISQVEQHMFRTIVEVVEASGNAMSAEGKSLTWDLVLDLIERVETGFDEEGNPNPVTLCMPPEIEKKLRSMPLTQAHLQRLADIKQRRRNHFLATKRSRQLFE